MTLPQSAVSDLLDALRAGDGVDLVRESVRIVLQELIEAEATEAIGAGPLARAYTGDPQVVAAAAALLSIVAVYHMADAVQAVMAQVLRGYKRATVPMVIYALSLWGVGLGGGYLLGLTDAFGPARGAAGFWLAAVASLVIAGAGVLAYFLRISAQTIPAPAITSA